MYYYTREVPTCQIQYYPDYMLPCHNDYRYARLHDEILICSSLSHTLLLNSPNKL